MINKAFVVSILLAIIGNFLYAQQDAEAKAILDKLAEKTKSYTVLSMDISYRMENKQTGESVDQEGEVVMSGEKYVMKLEDSEIYFDGTTMWTYVEEFGEVQITEPDPEEHEASFFSNPRRILEIYNEDYKYRLMGEISENGKLFYEIELYPKDLNQPYSKFSLLIEKESINLHSVSVFQKDGMIHLFTFSNLKTNFTIDNNSFTFNKSKYPGVEEVDLRL